MLSAQMVVAHLVMMWAESPRGHQIGFSGLFVPNDAADVMLPQKRVRSISPPG
jgi:hypothetical protein